MLTPMQPTFTGNSQLDQGNLEDFSKQMQQQQMKMTSDMMTSQVLNTANSNQVSKVNAAKDITKAVQL